MQLIIIINYKYIKYYIKYLNIKYKRKYKNYTKSSNLQIFKILKFNS